MSIIDNLENMLKGGRDDAMLRFGLGSAYFNDKLFEKAVPHLEACLTHDANYTAAYKLLGKAFIKLDRDKEALEVLLKGLPIAEAKGDKQTEREINAFIKKLNR